MSILIKNSKGISLLEAVAAAAILGISVVISAQMYVNSLKSVSTSQKKEVYPFLQTDIQSRLHGFVFNSKVDGTSANGKFCQLLQPESVDFGAVPVAVKLDRATLQSLFSGAEWEGFFDPIGKLGTESQCGLTGNSSGLSQCMVIQMGALNELFEGTPESANQALYSGMNINFYKVDPKGNNSFAPIDISAGGTFDSKEIIVELETDIRDSGKAVLSNRKQMYWLAEMGTCSIAGKEVAVSATGLGDKDGNRIYNATTYGVKPPEPFDVRYERKVIQEGKFLGDGSLVSDLEKNIAVACIETKYRCPNSGSKRSFLSPLNLEMKIDYSNDNKKFSLSKATVSPTFSFNGGGQDYPVRSSDVDLRVDGISYASTGNNDFYEILWDSYKREETVGYDYKGRPIKAEITRYRQEMDRKSPLRMTKGTHSVTVDIAGTDNMCDRVCENPTTKFYPRVDFKVKEKPSFKQSFQSANKLGCTVCLMKNCSRLGLGTFGPIEQYTDEPLDGRVPECVLNNTTELVRNNPIRNFGSLTGTGRCISAQLNASKDGLVLTREDCARELPVLCYNYGSFSLARDVDFQSNAFVQVPQSGSSRACYEMGREIMSKAKVSEMFDQYKWIDKGGLGQLFTIAETIPAPTGKNWLGMTLDTKHFVYNEELIRFQNNATQGLFIAPQTNDQVRSMATYMTKFQPTAVAQKFWVALESGTMGEVVAALPRLSTKNLPAEELSFYFSTDGRPYIVEDNYHPSQVFQQDANPVNQGMILGYGVRHKGLYVAKKEQGWNQTRNIKFLCKRKNSEVFFVSSREDDDMRYGHNYCGYEGGVFVPPATPLKWVHAMQEISRNSDDLPFPDPRKNENRTENQFVWVAMEGANYNFSWYKPSNWKTGIASLDLTNRVKFNKNFNRSSGKDHKVCINSSTQDLIIVDDNFSCPVGATRAKSNILSNDYYLAKLYHKISVKGNNDVVVLEP